MAVQVTWSLLQRLSLAPRLARGLHRLEQLPVNSRVTHNRIEQLAYHGSPVPGITRTRAGPLQFLASASVRAPCCIPSHSPVLLSFIFTLKKRKKKNPYCIMPSHSCCLKTNSQGSTSLQSTRIRITDTFSTQLVHFRFILFLFLPRQVTAMGMVGIEVVVSRLAQGWPELPWDLENSITCMPDSRSATLEKAMLMVPNSH